MEEFMREFEKMKAGNRYALNRRLSGTRQGKSREDGRYLTERTAKLAEKAFWQAVTVGHGKDLLVSEKEEAPKAAPKTEAREITVIYRRRKYAAA